MVGDIKQYIKNKLRIRQNEYKNDHDLIVSEYRRERELHVSYKGREILELLQNADDELTNDMPKEVCIVFDEDVLKFSNYGSPFDKDGIASLMYSNNSGKRNRKKKVIGNKGTGFRAILGWAKEIRIDSGDLHVKFSSKHAQNVLKDVVFEGKEVPKDLKAATLVFPEWIEDDYKTEYTTEISIHIKKNEKVAEDIRKQLLNLNANLLLFLNQTERIKILIDGKEIIYEKKLKNSNEVHLYTIVDEETVYEKHWFLKRKEGSFGDEVYGISIAYDDELEMPDEPYIYTYFRTDVQFPFPVLLHADFNLNGDRNLLVKDDMANAQILGDVADLMVETAIELFNEVTYDRLTFLLPQGNYSEGLQRYNFPFVLKEKMKAAKIFPTVNKKYVSFSPNLKYFSGGLSKWLSGKQFDELLLNSSSNKVDTFLLNLGLSGYSYEETTSRITAWVKSKKFSEENMRKLAYTAVRFVEKYESYYQLKSNNAFFPPFFYNSDCKLITNGNSIFLLDEDYQVTKPPVFANIEFMHPYMKRYLTKQLKSDWDDSDVEAIASKLDVLNVREYNASELIEHISDALNSRIRNGKLKEAISRWETTIKWLWVNRELLLKEDTSFTILMLTRAGRLVDSDELYYGSEYGNRLIDDLFEQIDSHDDLIIADIRPYVGQNIEEEEFIKFLQLFGVAKFPRRCRENRNYYGNLDDDYGFAKSVLGQVSYPLTLDNRDVFNSLEELCKKAWKVTITHSNIFKLNEILETASTYSLLKWIETDDKLKNELYSRIENQSFRQPVSVLWGDLRSPRPIAEIKKTYSFVYNLFFNIPWIEVQNRRYSIQDCILVLDNKKNNLADYLVVPDYGNYASFEKKGAGKKRRDFQVIFEKLGVKRDFSELSIDKIYTILLNLPYIPGSDNVARSLYNSLIDNNNRNYDKEVGGANYLKYVEEGMVYTNHGYQRIDETYYLSGRDLCDKVAQNFNLIAIPKRRNKNRIKKVLGIDVLNLNGEIVGTPVIHQDNGYFQSEFKSFKMMAFTYRLNIDSKNNDRAEARKFAKLSVTLCTDLKARYVNHEINIDQEIELDDYEYILDGTSHYYLKVPNEIELSHNVLLAGAIANIFSSYLDVDDVIGKYRELYLAGSYENREIIIQQEFEDEDILSKSSDALNFNEDIEDEFSGIISKLSGLDAIVIKKKASDLDFKNLNSIGNAPIIIELFREAGINIEDYNAEAPSILIDITTYLEREVSNFLPKCEERYKSTIYNQLLKQPIGEKKFLVERFLAYNSNKISVENDVYYQPQEQIFQQLNIDPLVELVDFKSIYIQNLNCWKKKVNNGKYIDTFLLDSQNKSLLYYAEYGELGNRYDSYCEHMEPPQEDKLDIEKADVHIDVYEAQAVRPVKSKSSKNKGEVRARIHTTGFTRNSSNKALEEIGFRGEKLVYDFLAKKYEIVKWRSENAQKAQVNPEGRAGEGYDMEYIDEQGMRKYVEVKASKMTKEQGIHFYMSDYEYQFGRKHAESYEIYYVSGAYTDNPQVLIIKDLFTGKGFNKKKYELNQRSEYEITAESLN